MGSGEGTRGVREAGIRADGGGAERGGGLTGPGSGGRIVRRARRIVSR